MVQIFILLAAILSAPLSIANSGPNAIQRLAANNFGTELLRCSAFFSVAEGGFKKSNSKEAEKKAKAITNRFLNLTWALSKMSGMTTKTMLRIREEAMKSMLKAMDYNYANYPLVRKRWMRPCFEVLKAPDARAKYWLEKARRSNPR